jgi:hypothetical protein
MPPERLRAWLGADAGHAGLDGLLDTVRAVRFQFPAPDGAMPSFAAALARTVRPDLPLPGKEGYINYAAARAVPSAPLEAFTGQAAEQELSLAGKVVILTSMRPISETPMNGDGRVVSAGYVHGLAVDNLLRGSMFRAPGPLLTLLTLLTAAVVGIGFGLILPPRGLPLAWALVFALMPFLSGMVLRSAGVFMPVFWPMAGAVAVSLLTVWRLRR